MQADLQAGWAGCSVQVSAAGSCLDQACSVFSGQHKHSDCLYSSFASMACWYHDSAVQTNLQGLWSGCTQQLGAAGLQAASSGSECWA